MCQIDALQYLRPDLKIVRAALANLPKDLDETYERVFSRIPEDARLFMQHVLHWMSTHRTIHQAIPGVERIDTCDFSKIEIPKLADLPCSVLFAAVQQSLANEQECDPMFLDGYVLDEELLREFCGCLVAVKTHTIRSNGCSNGEMSVVSFAHYTVLEFLESRRIRSGPAAPFALDRSRVFAEHATILLQGAISSVDQWALEIPDRPGPDVYGDFDRYCAQSSAILLHWHTALLVASGTASWLAPAVQILQMGEPKFGSLFWYPLDCLYGLQNPIAPAITGLHHVHKLKFLSPPSEPHIEILVRMLQVDERGHLARALLTSLGRTAEDFASRVDLEFQPAAFFSVYGEKDTGLSRNEEFAEIYRFRGSVLEYLAHLPTATWTQPWEGLLNMLDFAAGHFDPSKILFLFVANHQHDFEPTIACCGCLVVKKLLQLGARSTVPGYALGSLQVATARSDFAVVKMLLEAGIDPNDIGDLGGGLRVGTPDMAPMLRGFNGLKGRSSLNIFRERCSAYLYTRNAWMNELRSPTTEPMEELLVQYGAREFNAFSDPNTYLAAEMTTIQIDILEPEGDAAGPMEQLGTETKLAFTATV